MLVLAEAVQRSPSEGSIALEQHSRTLSFAKIAVCLGSSFLLKILGEQRKDVIASRLGSTFPIRLTSKPMLEGLAADSLPMSHTDARQSIISVHKTLYGTPCPCFS